MEAFESPLSTWRFNKGFGLGASWRTPSAWDRASISLAMPTAALKLGVFNAEVTPAGALRTGLSALWRPAIWSSTNSYSALGLGGDFHMAIGPANAVGQLVAPQLQQSWARTAWQWLVRTVHEHEAQQRQRRQPPTGGFAEVVQGSMRAYVCASNGLILSDSAALTLGLLGFATTTTPNLQEQEGGPAMPGHAEAGIILAAEIAHLNEMGKVVAAVGVSFLDVPFRLTDLYISDDRNADRFSAFHTLSHWIAPQTRRELEVYARMALSKNLHVKLGYNVLRSRASLSVGLVA